MEKDNWDPKKSWQPLIALLIVFVFGLVFGYGYRDSCAQTEHYWICKEFVQEKDCGW